ncbi:MAG: cobalamin-dependent protein [Alphaproteobacteria bacterium]|nr:cobalamin-dependent protein [Alphaproteobacteria bacterium]
MASLMLRNAIAQDGRVVGPHDPGGIAIYRDGNFVTTSNHGAQKSRLDLVIEAEIIPRLMVAHSVSVGVEAYQDPPVATTLDETDIDDFCQLILKQEVPVAFSYIEAIQIQGMKLESVFLDLLAPAARSLGTMWDEDTVSFADVTVGLSRLQQILRELSPNTDTTMDEIAVGHRALLASVPGDQHTFGVFMVEEFFRRGGWDVVTCVLESSEELLELAAIEEFSIIGFSTGRDDLLDQLASDVRSLYRVSKNKDVRILVGGRCFLDDPGLLQKIGADGTASNGLEAVSVANTLCGVALRG